MIFYLTHGYCGRDYHVHKSSKCHFSVHDPKHEEFRETIHGIENCTNRIKAIVGSIHGAKVIVYDGLKKLEVKK